jgi:thiamine biosynthesis lipoprotein
MAQPQPDINIVKDTLDSISDARHFSHEAMATTFGIFILHDDARYAKQAAWAAFDELDRLEAELSRFIENSDISRINNLAANQPLQIGLSAFECLQLSARIYDETDGAFDITIGSLMNCWLNEDKTKRSPSKEQLNKARQRTGTHLFKLDETEHTVELLTDELQIDLGGIGKGYAVDKMAGLLDDWGIDAALIHSGCSSVLAIGTPLGKKGWPVTLSSPAGSKQTLAYLYLRDRAVSGSGLQKGWHIIDPRTIQLVEGKSAAWACASDAATADALSTAFMVMSPEQVKQYCASHSDVLAMIITGEHSVEAQKEKVLRYGHWKMGHHVGYPTVEFLI